MTEETKTIKQTAELYFKVISKLIGPISPIGRSEIDEERLVNLKIMCEVTNQLVTAIDNVAYSNKDAYEASVKRAGNYAKDFITETLGIKE